MFSLLMNDIGYRSGHCLSVLLTCLLCLPLSVSSAEQGNAVDVSPWLKADIDWQQFSGTTLSVLANSQPAFKALQKKLPYFERLTGIKVGFHVIPQARMRDVRRIDLAAGAGIYDVVPIGISYLGEAYRQGWLEPLQPYFEDPKLTDACWYDLEDISPGSLALSSIDGVMLALPFDFFAPVFFYRKDLFQRYGLKVPDTYEELLQLKNTLQMALERDEMHNMYAFASRTRAGAGLNTWTIIPVIRAYGGEMMDASLKPVFNSPQAREALRVYRDMVTGYGSPPGAQMLNFHEIREAFKRGRLASVIAASDLFAEMDSPQESVIWDKWEAAPVPRGPHARATSLWSWGFAINASAEHKHAAWLFLQWASSRETAMLLHEEDVPARTSLWHSNVYDYLNAPGFIGVSRWILDQRDIDPIQNGLAEFPQVARVASQAFNEIFFGAPVTSTLNQAVVRVEQIMQSGSERSND